MRAVRAEPERCVVPTFGSRSQDRAAAPTFGTRHRVWEWCRVVIVVREAGEFRSNAGFDGNTMAACGFEGYNTRGKRSAIGKLAASESKAA